MAPQFRVMAGLDPATQGQQTLTSRLGDAAAVILGGRVALRLPGHDKPFAI
jgi:hypothetical protein